MKHLIILLMSITSVCSRRRFGEPHPEAPLVYNRSIDGPCATDTVIIDKLLLANDSAYNKEKVPKSRNMVVVIQVWVQEISSISELTQDFEIDLYMNEVWQDPRLRYEYLNPCKSNISLDNLMYDKIWTPNTCFINSKEASIHESPFRNIFLMIYPNGTLWTNYRVKLTGPCSMNLENFPMDVQQCSLTFESFNYNIEEVQMEWFKDPPILILKEINGKIELPDFTLILCTAKRDAVEYPAGYWHELTMTFTFRRRYGWYILQAYIPTYLTVFISWISFFLGPKSIPARTMLGVNALLAMTFQFGNILRNLPRVSYVKAIDVWMLSGMTFVFASLLELAIIGYLNRNNDPISVNGQPLYPQSLPVPPRNPQGPMAHLRVDKERRRSSHRRSRSFDPSTPIHYIDESIYESDMGNAETGCHCKLGIRRTSKSGCTDTIKQFFVDIFWRCYNIIVPGWNAERIDKISAIMFPTLFLLFNICYWGWYSNQQEGEEMAAEAEVYEKK